MKPKLKLISFKICPFVQRSVITLHEKNADFEIEYIDLNHKPEWFLKISPLGKVPVLMVNNEVLFESAVINEYLDETISPALHPGDALTRARNRSWIEFSSVCLNTLFNYFLAQTKDEAEKTGVTLTENLNRFGDNIKGPWFNGDHFSLLECAVAPVLYRIDFLQRRYSANLKLSNVVKEYSAMLINRPSVQKSVVPDFDILSQDWLKEKNSWLTK